MSEITRGVEAGVSYSSPALRQHMEKLSTRDCKPAAMLLFDRDGTESYAKELDRKYGWREDRTWGTMFTYRMWMPAPGSNDGDNTQLWLDPVGMVERHMGLAGSHVRFLTNNEPNHSDLKRTCDWHIAVMRGQEARPALRGGWLLLRPPREPPRLLWSSTTWCGRSSQGITSSTCTSTCWAARSSTTSATST